MPDLNSDEVDNLSLLISENRRVDTILKKLSIFESVWKELQKEITTISHVHALFDALIDEFPSTASRLSANAKIVYFSKFESALIKLQRGNTNTLSNESVDRLSDYFYGKELVGVRIVME